ncbi:MAG TPA: MgtC/SapB family protein [Sphingobacteriaceae bacterium]
MDTLIHSSEIIKIAVSIICGSILGFEREYRNKTAGFRTIILITLGSTIYTMVSESAMGESDDRIAANIITGVGFIGAGVIFKDNISITGLTTAAVIWVAAAIGMVAGAGNHSLALLLSLVVLIVLSIFKWIEDLIDLLHFRQTYLLKFRDSEIKKLEEAEELIRKEGLNSRRLQVAKVNEALVATLEISGKKNRMLSVNQQLIALPYIRQVNQTNASNSIILES